MSKIFFSYRSADSAIAERVLERLTSRYGRENVHTDLRPLAREPHSTRAYVEEFLEPFAVFVAIIGPTWVRSRGGAHRIDDPQDIVHLELAAALARGIPVIPVLVRGAEPPSAEALPDDLKTLTRPEFLRFGGDDTFRGDMMRLHRKLAAVLVKQETSPTVSERVETPPLPARKDQLNGIARVHAQAGKAPFEGVHIETLGEVLWILGAQHGELAKRYGERQFEPDLSGADLRWLNLGDTDLYGARLVGANLTGALLRGANLNDANLTGADLASADLTGARLNNASLASAHLELTNFTDCSLENADLSFVDLTTATLSHTRLQGIILHDAKLTGLDLRDVVLSQADLSSADLTDAELPRAQLDGANLYRARLNHADLSGARLTGSDLSSASLLNTDLSGADLSETVMGSVRELRKVIIDASTRIDTVKWRGKSLKDPKRIKDRDQRLRAYREAAQTYRDIAAILRDAGFLTEASSWRLREQKMRRGLLFDTQRYGAWMFSLLLFVVAGYGERIGRTLVTYFAVIFLFAALYYAGANYLLIDSSHLSLTEALIQSLVSFHGRGFVAASLALSSPMALITLVEAVCGLFIEVIFIASFSRRFLGF